jgi:hypothetical protein
MIFLQTAQNNHPSNMSGYLPVTNYMDLDEYIARCRKVNALPMVGVNIISGRKFRTDALLAADLMTQMFLRVN